MVINNDLIRDVLLCIERNIIYQTESGGKFIRKSIHWKLIYEDAELDRQYDIDDIKYCILKLDEAKLIKAVRMPNRSDRISFVDIDDITWEGYELLNNIRNDDIWTDIKKKLSGTGKVSLSVITQVAVEVAKTYVSSKLGLCNQ